MPYLVPFVNPVEHYQRIRTDFNAAIEDCLSHGDLIMRRHLREFEAHFAEYCGTRFCVGVNSGYHALALSLLAAGVGPGDEVITVGHTFVATVSAIVHAGATPVLVDVADDHNMDLDLVERAVTARTKVILPVHLNGRMVDMLRLQQIAERHRVLIVEDAAQAIGAKIGDLRAGSAGLAGCFSFYPFKMLGGFGDGGAVTTNDPSIARAVSLMRYNGEDRQTGEYHYHGYTALLDNVQAAVLDVKLRHLPSWIEHRRAIAARYKRALTGVGDLKLPHFADDRHFDVYQNYVIRTKDRDGLRAFLKDEGIETLVSWPKPMWHHPALRLGEHSLPVTEALCREVMSLPMSAETTEEHVDTTATAIRKFFTVRSSPLLSGVRYSGCSDGACAER
jgi:dTDP-4-amino-4,6-dideoxygalactose transaminase